MHFFRPTLESASALALTCGLLAVLLRRRRRVAAPLREAAIVFGLFACWMLIGRATHHYVVGAEGRGRSLFRFEHLLGLPSEVTVQGWVLPHAWLCHAINYYYLYGHLNGMAAILVWTFWRHRDAYPRLRLQVVLLCLTCLSIQLVGVAPPRLLPDLGFVDLATKYGESVYGDFGNGLPGQLLAMPSLHVGWAAVIAWTVWQHAPARWRWIGPLHLVLMTFAVVASANHWWLDGFVAMALLAVIVPVVDRLPGTRREAPPAPVLAAA